MRLPLLMPPTSYGTLGLRLPSSVDCHRRLETSREAGGSTPRLQGDERERQSREWCDMADSGLRVRSPSSANARARGRSSLCCPLVRRRDVSLNTESQMQNVQRRGIIISRRLNRRLNVGSVSNAICLDIIRDSALYEPASVVSGGPF